MVNNKISLENITAPILNDLAFFQEEFEKAIKSEVRLIDSISKFMIRNRGKNIRPILTILTARLCGEPTIGSYRAAAMMELLHLATLIHDDVVDDATLRRGKPSINVIWRNKLSVLMGDFLLSKALINMIGLKDFDALEQISSTAEKLSAGEILQIEKTFSKSMDEETYFQMIKQKTASLIATSCELGAITSTKNKKDRDATYKFGENFGIAFQIKDDIFDLLGSEKDTGKNKGGDVKKNMITLPLIFAKRNMSTIEKYHFNSLMKKKKKNKKTINRICELITNAGGIDYAKKKIDEYSEAAVNSISFYPDSPIKKSLYDLVSFNAFRTK